MSAITATATTLVSEDANKIREQFRVLLTKANKENPCAADVLALIDLLYKNKELQLWRDVVGIGALAESQVLDTILGNGKSGQGSRACWEERLRSIRADLGLATSSPLEQLLMGSDSILE